MVVHVGKDEIVLLDGGSTTPTAHWFTKTLSETIQIATLHPLKGARWSILSFLPIRSSEAPMAEAHVELCNRRWRPDSRAGSNFRTSEQTVRSVVHIICETLMGKCVKIRFTLTAVHMRVCHGWRLQGTPVLL